VAIKSRDNLRTHLLIGSDNIPEVFRIELTREDGRVHRSQNMTVRLASFGVRSRRVGWDASIWEGRAS